jgi:tRNA(Ile2) C34 agmatinyltransferase TiaS
MAEYIERQKVFDSLPTVVEDKTITLYGAVADFMVLVSAIPAADVVEVVHEKWEFIGNDYARCPNCGRTFEVRSTPYFFARNNKFCRRCGARMDGYT